MKELKVAIIGCGRISVMHTAAISALPRVSLVAACDVKRERADAVAKRYDARVYTSYEEMLESEELDAVHICLPHYLHSKVASYAFTKGVSVICEKPMDIDYESAERAVALAKECGVLYGIISQCRYGDAAQLVKDRVRSGKLGKIISARSTLTWTRPDEYYAESDWKGTWDKEGGGVLIDQAIHSLDLVNWIVDSEPASVSCSMANRGHKIVKVEDSAEGLIVYRNGVKYGFYCMNNYGCDEPIEIRLLCEGGSVTFGYNDAEIEYSDGSREELHDDYKSSDVEGAKDYWGNNHVRQIAQFYSALRGECELEISGEEALKTHALVMKLYEIGKRTM